MRAWHRVSGVALVVMTACGHPATQAPVVANHPPPPPVPAPQQGVEAVLAWPVTPFTPSQIAEVTSCDVKKLAAARYPKDLPVDALAGAFAPHGTCDQATLAATCAARVEQAALPASCLDAYRTTIKANPAFAFASGLVGGYFGKVTLVAAPPIAGHALVNVVVAYQWGGLGQPVQWTITAGDIASHPTIDVTGPNGKAAAWSPAVGERIAGLGHALTSFLPISKPLHAIDCTDNYPDWTATLTFDDGNKLELSTYSSNLLGLGGPWQMTIGGHTYLQLAPDFTLAIAKLIKTLELPIGQPAGEMCRGYDLQGAVLTP